MICDNPKAIFVLQNIVKKGIGYSPPANEEESQADIIIFVGKDIK